MDQNRASWYSPNMGLYKSCLLGAVVLLGLSAFQQAPTRSFSHDGADYRWVLMMGGATSSTLALVQYPDEQWGTPVAMLVCHGDDRGGLQVRDAAAEDRFVTLAANDRVFTVRGHRRDVGEIASVQGQGAFPRDWLNALGEAETITIAYGDVQRDFTGPGEDVVRRYQRDCRRLG